jgi:hypothetical protein
LHNLPRHQPVDCRASYILGSVVESPVLPPAWACPPRRQAGIASRPSRATGSPALLVEAPPAGRNYPLRSPAGWACHSVPSGLADYYHQLPDVCCRCWYCLKR